MTVREFKEKLAKLPDYVDDFDINLDASDKAHPNTLIGHVEEGEFLIAGRILYVNIVKEEETEE